MTEAGGWTPDKDTVEDANLTRFLAWLADTGRGDFADYHELWSKSVRDVEWFWDAVWHFFEIRASTPPTSVLREPGNAWRTMVSGSDAELCDGGVPARKRRAAGADCGRRGRLRPNGPGHGCGRRPRRSPHYLRRLGVNAGRPGRRLPTQHRRGGRGVSRRGQRRRDLGGVQSGPRRRAEWSSRLGTTRADRAGGQRRVGVRRETP